MRLGQWDREAKHRAAMAILGPDGASVTFDDRTRDGQSQPRPLRLRFAANSADAGSRNLDCDIAAGVTG